MAALKNITDELAKIAKALEKKGQGKGKNKADPDLDNNAINFMFNSLLTTFKETSKYISKEENLCPKVKEIEKSSCQIEDQMDDQQQKSCEEN